MVSPVDPVVLAMERNWEMIDGALEGLDEAALSRQPTDQCNSVAWILWHLTRVTDMFIHSRLRDLTQVWVSEGWHEKFGMPADEEDRGVGWSAAQVAQWNPPSKGVQLAHYEAVKNHARDFLANITQEELERTIVELEEEMIVAAEDLRFEEAARIRDELRELRRDLEGMRAGA